MRHRTALLLLALGGASCASAQSPAPAPNAPPKPLVNPVGNNDAAGGANLPADANLDQILSALHARGQDLKDFVSTVSMTQEDALTGDATILTGKVWYQNRGQGNTRIRVVFDGKKIGDRTIKDFKQEYLLDNGWLIERDYKQKLQVDRQVLRPGDKFDPLKLGEGPFPLPIGQDPNDVKKQFDAKKIDADPKDPQGTVHVQLVPKPETRLARKFKRIDVWVNTGSKFPQRIVTTDRNETANRITEMTDLAVNTGLNDAAFTLDKVENWAQRAEALE